MRPAKVLLPERFTLFPGLTPSAPPHVTGSLSRCLHPLYSIKDFVRLQTLSTLIICRSAAIFNPQSAGRMTGGGEFAKRKSWRCTGRAMSARRTKPALRAGCVILAAWNQAEGGLGRCWLHGGVRRRIVRCRLHGAGISGQIGRCWCMVPGFGADWTMLVHGAGVRGRLDDAGCMVPGSGQIGRCWLHGAGVCRLSFKTTTSLVSDIRSAIST